MLEFIIDRYNYWIVIVLMMMGLYIVISRGNLVKKVIGLNLFQTSVFIFYISIGKIFGGTAPILIGGHGDEHGDGHGGDGHGGDHGDAAHGKDAHDGGHGADAGGAAHDVADHAAAGSDKITNVAPEKPESLHSDLGANPADVTAGHAASGDDGGKILNDFHAAKDAANKIGSPAPEAGFDVKGADAAAAADPAHGGEAATAAAEIIYTNPLPHVLILTAIVVGVATTAVGLALAVRIHEAYGTIEEDELETDDHIAEFGHELGETPETPEGAPA